MDENNMDKINMDENNQSDENIILMKQCIDDAKTIVYEKRLLESQSAITNIAIALFKARKKV